MSEQLYLENQLCFRIYSLNKAINKLYAPLLKELGLTYPQYLVMLVLWQKKTPVHIKDICQALDLDTGTLSPLLKRMVENELVSKKRSTEDERAVFIALTDKGRSLKSSACDIPQRLISSTSLNLSQLTQIQHTLDNLLAATKSTN